jgi:hypothetical protein
MATSMKDGTMSNRNRNRNRSHSRKRKPKVPRPPGGTQGKGVSREAAPSPSAHSPAARHGTRYPWREWLSFGSFTLIQGTHYTVRTDSMALMVRQASARLGVEVSVSLPDDMRSVYVVVLNPLTPKAGR